MLLCSWRHGSNNALKVAAVNSPSAPFLFSTYELWYIYGVTNLLLYYLCCVEFVLFQNQGKDGVWCALLFLGGKMLCAAMLIRATMVANLQLLILFTLFYSDTYGVTNVFCFFRIVWNLYCSKRSEFNLKFFCSALFFSRKNQANSIRLL